LLSRLRALLPPPSPSGQGFVPYPVASPSATKVGAWIARAATAWMFLVSCWGILGVFPDGHFAATANIGTAAWSILKFHIPYPMMWTTTAPHPSQFYVHHPFGVFWVAALFIKIFGAHSWVIRLPAVIYSTATPYLLYRLGRAVWGPIAGAFSALTFVSLPITLGFSNFHALEGPVICGCTLATWGFVRYAQTYRERYSFASVFGILFAVNNDWAAYLWGGAFTAMVFVIVFLRRERPGDDLRPRQLGRTWALMVSAAVGSLALMIYFVASSNTWSDLLGSYDMRSAGRAAPLSYVLDRRHVWIELMFPRLAIVLGKVGLFLALARAVLLRRWVEALLPIPFFVMAVLQYVVFKQGADYHIFWPQYFAPYLALVVGALVATLDSAAARFLPRLLERWPSPQADRARPLIPWAGALVMALPALLLFRDGASMIRLAHETGGRFNSEGIEAMVDKATAMRWYLARYPKETQIAHHPTTTLWALQWESGNLLTVRNTSVGSYPGGPRLYMLDTGWTTVADMKEAVARFKVTAVGRIWLIDRQGPPSFESYSFDEKQPNLLQWYFYGGVDPVRTVVPDPYVGWEQKTLLGLTATLPPKSVPVTIDQLRIAHNEALSRGDQATANRYLLQLMDKLNMPVQATYSNGTMLIGGYHNRGAERSFTLVFKAGKYEGRGKFAVTGEVLHEARFSTLAYDSVPMQIATPPAPPTELWKQGHLYSIVVPYRKRPGTERYTGRFVTISPSPAPTRVGGPPDVQLAIVH
jgi:hypothetical protein